MTMPTDPRRGEHIVLDVSAIEFFHGGNTLWVHAADGSTTLRIKCTGKVLVDRCVVSPTSHGDMIVNGDIHVCIGKEVVHAD